MKFLLKAFVLAILMIIPNVAFATQSGNVRYVEGFERMVTLAVLNGYTQDKIKSPAINYACGAVSLDLALIYHMTYGKTPNPTDATFNALFNTTKAIERLRVYYTGMGISFNNPSGITTNQINSFVRNHVTGFWAIKADGNNTALQNLELLKPHLTNNFPVIIAFDANAPENPVRGSEHIVVVYKYDGNQKKLSFYDPYYGRVGTVHEDNLSSFSGNFPYLRIYPQ